MSVIIAIEGVDGVGKTTLCQHLESYLGKKNCVTVSSPSKILPIGKLLRKEFHDPEGRFSSLSGSGKLLLEDYLHKSAILENCFYIHSLLSYPFIFLDRWIYSFYTYSRTLEFDYTKSDFFDNTPFSGLSNVPVIYINPPSKRVLQERMENRSNPTKDDLDFDKAFQRHDKFLRILNYLVPEDYIRISSPFTQKEMGDIISFIRSNKS